MRRSADLRLSPTLVSKITQTIKQKKVIKKEKKKRKNIYLNCALLNQILSYTCNEETNIGISP